MTLKLIKRGWNSVKGERRLSRIPYSKRLDEIVRANWLKRYRIMRTCH
ncbi:MAG: hypothetical protein KDK08_05660 [Rhizobiaceae bacterium]|nr:hypothetical protein [Rhizobiaceae bacterium]